MEISLRTSYNIYCSQNFIGFCIIQNNGSDIQASLLLFENIKIGSNTQHPNSHKTYPINISDIDIIKDLMLNAIPSLRTNGLNYTAKMNGEIYKI